MRFLFLGLLAMGCVPKGQHPLAPAGAVPIVTGILSTQATAVIDSVPSRGLDLITTLDVTNTGEKKIRVDLTRARIRVDEIRFDRCKQGATTDPTKLIANLEPGTSAQLRVTCTNIEKPVRIVELRFQASGIGQHGEITLGFVGLGERP